MTVKKPYLPILFSLMFIPALVSSAWAQTADEIIEKHLTAIGGRAALGKSAILQQRLRSHGAGDSCGSRIYRQITHYQDAGRV